MAIFIVANYLGLQQLGQFASKLLLVVATLYFPFKYLMHIVVATCVYSKHLSTTENTAGFVSKFHDINDVKKWYKCISIGPCYEQEEETSGSNRWKQKWLNWKRLLRNREKKKIQRFLSQSHLNNIRIILLHMLCYMPSLWGNKNDKRNA